MIRRVTFNSLAERELNEAARYYEVESPGLVLLSIEKRSGVLPEYWNSQKRAL